MTVLPAEHTEREAARLATLRGRGVSDTLPEPDFDDIAQLAAQICSAPVALITLVVEARQFIKARIGVEGNIAWPMEGGFCPDVVQTGESVVLPDIQEHPRHAGNPAVAADGVRFFAAVPLVGPDRHVRGTLCVLDRVPRPQGLAQAQRSGLEALARQVVLLLEARRLARKRGERDRRNEAILESAVDYGVISMDMGGLVTSWSTGAERILGWMEPEMLGRPAQVIFTAEDIADGVPDREMHSALLHGRGNDERWHRKKDGTRFFALGELMPLRDKAGGVEGFIKVLRDRTAEHEKNEALKEAQRRLENERGRLAQMFQQAPSFMAMLRGPNHVFELTNPAYGRLIGHRDVVGRPVAEALPDAAAQGYVDRLDDVYATGRPFSSNGALYALQPDPDGPIVERYVDFVFQPVTDLAGKVTGIFIEGIDVTDRLASARRLRETEDRYRALAENVDVGMCIIEMRFDETGRPVDYRILEGNEAYERHTGLYGSVGKWVSEVAPGLERHWFELYGRVALTGEPVRFENGAAGLGGRWFEVQALRVGEPAKHQVAILFFDVTTRKQAEERRSLLNEELSHRLKNTLAIVQSIVAHTLRTTPDVAEARKVLSERIQTLSRAHDILLSGARDAGSIKAVVRSAVALHDAGERISLTGPDLTLGPKAALALALTVHELATNAGKYGALFVPDGRVDVVWSVDTDGTRPVLTITWTERGGPPVVAPSRRGFGTRLIQMGLSGSAGGTVDIDYDPAGLRCRIVAPLTELQDDQ